MVPVHRAVLERFPSRPLVAVLDTPYGFQENADELTARALDYFRTSLPMARVEEAVAALPHRPGLIAGTGPRHPAPRRRRVLRSGQSHLCLPRLGGDAGGRHPEGQGGSRRPDDGFCRLDHPRPLLAAGLRGLQGGHRPGLAGGPRHHRGGGDPGRGGPSLEQRRGRHPRHQSLLAGRPALRGPRRPPSPRGGRPRGRRAHRRRHRPGRRPPGGGRQGHRDLALGRSIHRPRAREMPLPAPRGDAPADLRPGDAGDALRRRPAGGLRGRLRRRPGRRGLLRRPRRHPLPGRRPRGLGGTGGGRRPRRLASHGHPLRRRHGRRRPGRGLPGRRRRGPPGGALPGPRRGPLGRRRRHPAGPAVARGGDPGHARGTRGGSPPPPGARSRRGRRTR